MYCHNFHLVLSDADFPVARLSTSCLWVISHMMNMCPNLISLLHRILFYVLGMCASIQLSLVGLFLILSRHLGDMSWLGVLLMIILFSEFLILIGKYCVLSVYYDETIHTWRLWWLPSSVVCGILFKDIKFGMYC